MPILRSTATHGNEPHRNSRGTLVRPNGPPNWRNPYLMNQDFAITTLVTYHCPCQGPCLGSMFFGFAGNFDSGSHPPRNRELHIPCMMRPLGLSGRDEKGSGTRSSDCRTKGAKELQPSAKTTHTHTHWSSTQSLRILKAC